MNSSRTFKVISSDGFCFEIEDVFQCNKFSSDHDRDVMFKRFPYKIIVTLALWCRSRNKDETKSSGKHGDEYQIIEGFDDCMLMQLYFAADLLGLDDLKALIVKSVDKIASNDAAGKDGFIIQ
jgi:hypothetical protein